MKKSHIFANENDNEPTALATFPKNGIPVLSGEVAERFLRIAHENEERAKKRKNKPITKEEAERMIGFKKIMLEYEKNNVKNLEEEIKKLEEIINSPN